MIPDHQPGDMYFFTSNLRWERRATNYFNDMFDATFVPGGGPPYWVLQQEAVHVTNGDAKWVDIPGTLTKTEPCSTSSQTTP